MKSKGGKCLYCSGFLMISGDTAYCNQCEADYRIEREDGQRRYYPEGEDEPISLQKMRQLLAMRGELEEPIPDPPSYETRNAAAAALHDRLPESTADALLDTAEDAAQTLFAESSVGDKINPVAIRHQIQISIAERTVAWLDSGIFDGEADVQDLIERIDRAPVTAAMYAAARVENRHESLLVLTRDALLRTTDDR